ncbi:MAG TPA: IPT/TIG domain-containing protein, partial [Solirubrobacteraceae bacterium]
DSLTPVAVTGLSAVTAIAAGGDHSLALTSSGAVRAWGNGSYGQLGNEKDEDSHVPVAVSGLPNDVVAIAGGGRHSLAQLSGGTLKAWGGNEFGQLGIGTSGKNSVRLAPVSVNGLSGVVSISAGLYSNLALLTNKTIAGWGGDEFGQLGIGEAGPDYTSNEPVMMCGVLEAGGISAGNFSNYVYGVTSTLPCPAVSGISPGIGPQAGGTSVTITGTGFTGATAVEFGPLSTTNFTVDSPTEITAVTPRAVPLPENGFLTVKVKTAAGTSPNSGVLYGFLPPPSVEKLKPHKGPAAGGTKVTIYGARFSSENVELQGVKFGTVNATSFELVTIQGRRAISAIAPPHAGGTVDVTISTQWGTSAPVKTDHFKFGPSVTGVTPSSGSKTGGETVTITGTGFAVGTNTTTVKFGSTKAKSVSCSSTSECSVVVPAHAAGVVDVKVTANKASSTASPPGDQFKYE